MSVPVVDDHDLIGRTEIEAHLGTVLRSPAFRGSKRCQDFLRFVVNETLNGNADAIKERNIAVSVFERGTDYEPSLDSIVRVKANEVRKRLAKFYETSERNVTAGIRIDLNPGAYVPVFRRLTAPATPELDILDATPSPAVHRQSSPWRMAAMLGAAAAIVAATFLYWQQSQRTELDRLWRPMIGHSQQVLLCLPSPRVPENLGDGNTRVMEQYYVGVGAAQGAALFGAILGGYRQPFEIKIGRDLSFADLRRQPAVMLGGFSSPWTLELTRQLRFRLTGATPSTPAAIIDSSSGKVWLGNAPEASSKDMLQDYALVSRVLDSGSGQTVLMAAGLSAYGTQAASEFLSNEALVANFARQLGPGWDKKNFQAVLHCTVHGFTPSRPEVVAWHVW